MSSRSNLHPGSSRERQRFPKHKPPGRGQFLVRVPGFVSSATFTLIERHACVVAAVFQMVCRVVRRLPRAEPAVHVPVVVVVPPGEDRVGHVPAVVLVAVMMIAAIPSVSLVVSAGPRLINVTVRTVRVRRPDAEHDQSKESCKLHCCLQFRSGRHMPADEKVDSAEAPRLGTCTAALLRAVITLVSPSLAKRAARRGSFAPTSEPHLEAQPDVRLVAHVRHEVAVALVEPGRELAVERVPACHRQL